MTRITHQCLSHTYMEAVNAVKARLLAKETGMSTVTSKRSKSAKRKRLEAATMGEKSKISASQGEMEVTSESEEDDAVPRPNGKKVLHVTKKGFLEQLSLLNHPLLQDPDGLELAYRCIDLSNLILTRKRAAVEESIREEEEDLEANPDKFRRALKGKDKTDGKGQDNTPNFFNGDMTDTMMVNGVDQIQQITGASTWNRALHIMLGSNGVYVADIWAVKKDKQNKVVSCLVKFPTRYQKYRGMDIFNDVRMRMEADMERGTRSRINARDAFQQEDMGYVRECYNRGWQLKKDKNIDSYRILNAG